MPFHHLIYDTALGVNAAFTELVPAVDPYMPRNTNNRIKPEKPLQLVGSFYHAVSATRARITTPSYAALGNINLVPTSRSLLPDDVPAVKWYDNGPLMLPSNEEIIVQGSNNLGAATERSFCHLFLTFGAFNWGVAPVRVFPVLCNYTITSVANQWTGPGALTFPVSLATGRYKVWGMHVVDANVVACRLIFGTLGADQLQLLRPGVPVMQDAGAIPNPRFAEGLGEWGNFRSDIPPQVEIYANNAAAHTGDVWLWLSYSPTA